MSDERTFPIFCLVNNYGQAHKLMEILEEQFKKKFKFELKLPKNPKSALNDFGILPIVVELEGHNKKIKLAITFYALHTESKGQEIATKILWPKLPGNLKVHGNKLIDKVEEFVQIALQGSSTPVLMH